MRRFRALPWLVAALVFGCTFAIYAQRGAVPGSSNVLIETNATDPDHVFHVHVIGEGSSYVLQNVKSERFLGIHCMTGTYAEPSVQWLHGLTVRIPADKIALIAEYDSLENYRERLATFSE